MLDWLFGPPATPAPAPARSRGGRQTITVAAPWCVSQRGAILTAFQPYGVVVHDIKETLVLFCPLAMLKSQPSHFRYAVEVNEQAAEWAEYLLLRSSKTFVIPPGVRPANRKNAQWVAGKRGTMPIPWKNAKGETQQWKGENCNA